MFLTDYFNLQTVRKKIALAAQEKNPYYSHFNNNNNNNSYNNNNSNSEGYGEGLFVSRKRKKSTPSRSRKTGDAQEGYVLDSLYLSLSISISILYIITSFFLYYHYWLVG